MKQKNEGTGSQVFNITSVVIIIGISLVCIFPFIHIVATSLSSGRAIMSGEVSFLPVELHTSSYEAVIKNSTMMRSFGFTIGLTVLYTAVCMFMTICAAYSMSKRDLPGRRFFMTLIVLTMYFNAGIIPNFIIVKSLGLMDTIWALILPGAISAYNMFILRTSFMVIPQSLTEAAYIDGCSEIRILVRIIVPLSIPIIATISLFYAVGRWNGFSDALYYISSPQKYPLQLRLREIIMIDRMSEIHSLEGGMHSTLVPEGIKAASIVFATLPILIPYPFLQRFFISGVMIGSIKE